mgnify:CR=1 FL=1
MFLGHIQSTCMQNFREILGAVSKAANYLKNRLDKHWQNQEVLYDNYRAEINVITGTGDIDKRSINEENDEPGEEDRIGPVLGTNPK